MYILHFFFHVIRFGLLNMWISLYSIRPESSSTRILYTISVVITNPFRLYNAHDPAIVDIFVYIILLNSFRRRDCRLCPKRGVRKLRSCGSVNDADIIKGAPPSTYTPLTMSNTGRQPLPSHQKGGFRFWEGQHATENTGHIYIDWSFSRGKKNNKNRNTYIYILYFVLLSINKLRPKNNYIKYYSIIIHRDKFRVKYKKKKRQNNDK